MVLTWPLIFIIRKWKNELVPLSTTRLIHSPASRSVGLGGEERHVEREELGKIDAEKCNLSLEAILSLGMFLAIRYNSTGSLGDLRKAILNGEVLLGFTPSIAKR